MPRARARISASALSLPPDHMSAWRSGDAEGLGDGAVAHLFHAETRDAAPRRALAGAEVRPGAVKAEEHAAAHAADRVSRRIDRVTAGRIARRRVRAPRRVPERRPDRASLGVGWRTTGELAEGD